MLQVMDRFLFGGALQLGWTGLPADLQKVMLQAAADGIPARSWHGHLASMAPVLTPDTKASWSPNVPPGNKGKRVAIKDKHPLHLRHIEALKNASQRGVGGRARPMSSSVTVIPRSSASSRKPKRFPNL